MENQKTTNEVKRGEGGDIDAVAMTRAIRDAHYDALKEASMVERIRFFRAHARALRAELGVAEPTEDRGAG
jgi:hypothetical protein